jgi:hypothetical protein
LVSSVNILIPDNCFLMNWATCKGEGIDQHIEGRLKKKNRKYYYTRKWKVRRYLQSQHRGHVQFVHFECSIVVEPLWLLNTTEIIQIESPYEIDVFWCVHLGTKERQTNNKHYAFYMLRNYGVIWFLEIDARTNNMEFIVAPNNMRCVFTMHQILLNMLLISKNRKSQFCNP